MDSRAEDVDDALVDVGTVMYWLDALFQVATTCGSDGKTSKRPTPLLQQFTVWSQQYDVSIPVTLEQEMRSVPPVLALRQKCEHSGDSHVGSEQEPRTTLPSGPLQSLLSRHAHPWLP